MHTRLNQWMIWLALAGLGAASNPLSASIVTWTGAGDGSSWEDAANWDLARLPAATDDVLIPDVARTEQLFFSGITAVVQSLACFENVRFDSGTLEIAGAFAFNAGLRWDSGTLRCAADGDIFGTFDYRGGTKRGPGTIRIRDLMESRAVGNRFIEQGTLENRGRVVFFSRASIFLGSQTAQTSGAFVNATTGTVEMRTAGELTMQANFSDPACKIVNHGAWFCGMTPDLQGRATAILNAPFENHGSLTLEQNRLQFGRAQNTSGLVQSGTFTLADNTLLILGGTTHTFFAPDPATFGTNSRINMNGGTTKFVPRAVDEPPIAQINASVTINNAGVLNAENTEVQIQQALDFNFGSITGNGTTMSSVSANGSSTFETSATKIFSNVHFAQGGPGSWRDGDLTLTNGAIFEVKSGGSLTLEQQVRAFARLRTSPPGSSTFKVKGRFVFNPGLLTTAILSILETHIESGATVEVQSGTTQFAGNTTIAGTVQVNEFAAVEMNSPTADYQYEEGAQITGNGKTKLLGNTTHTVNGDTLIGTAQTQLATLTAPDAQVTINIPNCNTQLTLEGETTAATLNKSGPGVLENRGHFLNLTSNDIFTIDGTFRNRGFFDLNDAELQFDDRDLFDGAGGADGSEPGCESAVLENTETGVVLLNVDRSNGFVRLNGQTRVKNNGQIRFITGRPGRHILFGVPLDHEANAAISIEAGEVGFSAPVNLKGTVNLIGGDAAFVGNQVNVLEAALINVPQNRKLIADNAEVIIQDSAAISGDGSLEGINGARLNFLDRARVALRNILIANGVVDISGQTTVDARFLEVLDGLLVASGGDLDLFAEQVRALGDDSLISIGGVIDALRMELAQGATLGGSGAVTGDVVNNSGNVNSGNSPGRLTINGNYTQGAAGRMTVEVAGRTPGSEHDVLTINGTADIAGTVTLIGVEPFRPTRGDRFTFLTATGGVTGNFQTLDYACAAFLWQFVIDHDPNEVALAVVNSLRGDLNCTCAIDFDDIDPFVVALVSAETYAVAFPGCEVLRGDFDASGGVDFNDIDPFVQCLVLGGCP